VHRMRTVPAGMPGGLHQGRARPARPPRTTGWQAWSAGPGRTSATRYRLPPQARAAQTARTTSAWPPRPRPSWPTSPAAHPAVLDRPREAALDRKRAIIEAADCPRHARPTASRRQRRMTPTQVEPFFATLRAANPQPRRSWNTAACSSCWPPCCCRPRPPTSASTRPRAAVSTGQHAAGHAGPGRGGRTEQHIRTIGLYRTKARTCCRPAASCSNSTAARCRAPRALEALPGVGRKTANVVLNVAFGEPTMAVDTHIFRVATAPAWRPGKTPLDSGGSCCGACRRPTWVDAHHWLILHGRYVCQARKPAMLHRPLRGAQRQLMIEQQLARPSPLNATACVAPGCGALRASTRCSNAAAGRRHQHGGALMKQVEVSILGHGLHPGLPRGRRSPAVARRCRPRRQGNDQHP
jgi:endonuclease-3